MAKVTALGAPSGNWNSPGTCTNSSCGKTVYKNAFDTANAYKCPYCGHNVT